MSRMDILELWIQIFLIGKRPFYCIAFLFPISYLIMTGTVKSNCSNIYHSIPTSLEELVPKCLHYESFFAQDF